VKDKNKLTETPTPEMLDMLKQTASPDRNVAANAMQALAQALQEPLREAVLAGDITQGIFSVENLEPGAQAEYPLSFYRPGMEDQYNAYVIPAEGALPMRTVMGDNVTVQTYSIGNEIDWSLKYARQARWPVVQKIMKVLEAGFVKKLNTDAWRVLICAAYGRGFHVEDSNAAAGQFTKRLVSLLKTTMARRGGGNTTSVNPVRLTDLYLSLEAMEDIREWTFYSTTVSIIDPVTMREIFTNEDGALSRIYGVNLHALAEMGEGQEFNKYFDDDQAKGGLGGTFANGDLEIVVGLDQGTNDSFVMPVKEPLTIFDDPTLHRHQKAGVYGWQEHGLAVLDDRRVILGTL